VQEKGNFLWNIPSDQKEDQHCDLGKMQELPTQTPHVGGVCMEQTCMNCFGVL